MSSAALRSLSPEVLTKLTDLRRQIRKYVFWEGLALVVTLAGLLFWGSFLVDTTYFRLSRLELPQSLRAAFLIGSLAALAGGLVSLLVFRTLRGMRSRALALLLERRFPQLGDGLITAVEATEGGWQPSSDIEKAMLQRTIADASRSVQRLNVSEVFDPGPLRRAAIAAVMLVVSILGLAVVDSSAMERWIDGYWRLRDAYWPRETALKVRVLTQPGDQLRDFVDGRYRHPRGGDLQIVIESAEGKQVPDRIRVDYRIRNGSWKRSYLTASADQPFQMGFPGLLDDLEFWVTGGDFATASPWRVAVVDAPRVDQMTLGVLYPAYTGLNAVGPTGVAERSELPLLGSQVTLPLGSDVQLRAAANKALNGVRIEIDANGERFEWQLRREPESAAAGRVVQATLTVRAREEFPQRTATWSPDMAAPLMSDDGQSFLLPFVMQRDGAQTLREFIEAAASGPGIESVPIPWPADAVLRMHFEDTDGIVSPDPLRLTINAQVDAPPVVEVELKGISPLITRQARIPVVGWIRDEYGVSSARFEYQIDNATEWKPQQFAAPPAGATREFELSRSASERYERFDVLPLDLSVKQRLSLTVWSADGDNLYGPNDARSQKFVFTVVPVEELLSLLYEREINLRKRFEQLLSELKELQKDLDLHRQRAEQVPNETGTMREQTLASLSACAERSLTQVRKSAAEMLAIQQAFSDIRDELVNNSAETPQNMDRLETKILRPISRANEESFPAVDASLGLFSLANRQQRSPLPAIRESEQELEILVKALERVLLEMRKLETFHEALELLKAIIGSQDELMEETRTQRKARALRALEEE